MNKVVYLLGAGASANALPVVNALPERMRKMADYLDQRISEINENESVERATTELSRKKHCQNLITGLRSLAEEAQKSASIDTLAKKHYLRKGLEELKRLKLLLCTYFSLEQANTPADFRYDAFLAAILESQIRGFPDNLRILSWNYDMQFEYAYSGYSNSMEISTNQVMLNTAQKNTHNEIELNKFSIVKLNGTASLYQKSFRNQFYFTNKITSGLNIDVIREIIDGYATCSIRDDVSTLLSFAWEREIAGATTLENAKIAASNATTLVIIGYSFPLFNRSIDKIISDQMPSLSKVYIQAPEEHAKGIKERFLALRNNPASVHVSLHTNTEQFLIPYEF